MKAALFDSNILIDYLNHRSQTKSELARYRSHAISVITWIEVMAGCKAGQESMLRSFLDLFEVKTLTTEIAERTAEIRQERRMKIPDAIIAATAEVHGLLLVTRNSKDFDPRSPGIRIPYQLKP